MARVALTTKQKLEKILSNFELFCKNFVKIVDNNGDLIPFKLNDQQREFINSAGKFNIILKPRQLGFTTVQLAYCLWMAIKNPNTNYMIMSYKGDSSKALLEKLKMMDKHLPREKYPNVFPETDRSNRDEIVFSNGSRIIPATSGTKDVGRGLNLMYILLSEYAFMDNQNQLLLSLEPALQKTERSRIVIETTANGFNDFQRLYDKAKKGRSKYKSFFFPFFSSAYEKQFAYDIQQAVMWYMATNKGKRLSKKDLSIEQKQLHDMGCSLNMLMWREWMLMDKDKNELD
ncbi:terminase large subunit domain-containing protein [Paenibacillus thermotolerans]|uniref:terminase large subunit domain-containing protein n=1 Tax=Paenibacillus thermotolerans TaxID=3027807 RepID=UPI002367D68A|nr:MULTISPECIES: terminase family protein [unclassified Paenibacillus]